MLKIIEGSFYSDGRELFKREIEKALSDGLKVKLIVPEQQTVIAEKEFSELLPSDSPLYFEVTNFTRFSNSVFRALGGVDKEYCDTARSALIMWRALSELAPFLSLTDEKKEISYGMVKRALATVGEADSLSVGADELNLALDRLSENEPLRRKVDDLIKITSLYKRLLKEKYADVGEDIGAAARMLSEDGSVFADTVFFLDGFTSFTEPQYGLIELFVRRYELTVLLGISRHMRDAFEYTESMETKRRLSAIAKRAGCEEKLISRDTPKRSEELYEICNLLWRTDGSIDNFTLPKDDTLRIIEAATPYDACDFISADIRRRVMEGAAYRDFAVISSDVKRYRGILDISARSAEVPIFISEKKDVSSFEAIKLIYAAIASASGGFKREDVISYSKCALSAITREECDLFELYTERWQISGKRFTDGVIWNMNPDGLLSFRTEQTDKALVRIDGIRKRLIEPLCRLGDMLSASRTVKDFATAIYSFTQIISLSDRIDERIKELSLLGEHELAEENERLYPIILDSLDTLVEVSGDTESDLDGFISQLKIVFSAASVSRIPSFTDVVTAGSAAMLRLNGKKHVYMLGINKGEFPADISSESYFSEKDRDILSAAGLPFTADSLIKEARERYSFSRAFSYATESVTLVYSNKTSDFSAQRRADVIDRIISVSGEKIKPIRVSDMKKSRLIYSPSQALQLLGGLDEEEYREVKAALDDAGYGDEVALAEMNVEIAEASLSDDALSLIYKGELELSQSKIDSYNTCPLAYFCKYDLALSDNERAEFDARNIGSFVHAILESFFKLARGSNKDLGGLSEEEKREMVKASAEQYLDRIVSEGEIGSKRTEMLIRRLIGSTMPIVNGLCEEFATSQYSPEYFELKIGGGRDISPEMLRITDADGSSTLIKGSIDRVDTYKYGNDVYVRVVDYKTGQKDFSPDDLEKGKNLQMFLYLKAVVDSRNEAFHRDIGLGDDGRMIPAGVIYVKSDLADTKISHASPSEEDEAVKKEQKRDGMLLCDPISLSAMNIEFLPIKINKDGSYSKDSQRKLYDEGGWSTLSETVENAVKRVSAKMRSGNISANPLIESNTSPCSYCKFKPICRNAKIK